MIDLNKRIIFQSPFFSEWVSPEMTGVFSFIFELN